MTHRNGVTLVEVLVAIFVMGIGLIALLTLFPIGMLRMARAIHDEKSSQCAQIANANLTVFNLCADADVNIDANGLYTFPVRPNDVFNSPAPHNPLNPFNATPYLLPADLFSESYPIFVDPIGFYNVSGQAQNWVGGVLPTTNRLPATANSHKGGLRRRPVEYVRNGLGAVNTAPLRQARNLRIMQSFTLWDDMNFEYDPLAGTPGAPKAVLGTVLRDPRFSWGYTMQRPLSSDKSIVNVAVVVFDKRSLSVTTNAVGNGALAENVYQSITYFNPINNTITIDYTNPAVVPPPVRPGDWILDVTPYNPTATSGSAHHYWYRVVAAEELTDAGNKYARYEVQQPIRGIALDSNNKIIRTTFTGQFTSSPNNIIPLGFQGTSVFLEGVAEVYDKGAVRLP